MKVTTELWRYGGAALLAAISLLILRDDAMNVWVPMPIYLVVLYWIVSYLFVVFTPVLYFLAQTFAPKSRHFSLIILALVVVFSILNILYFYKGWTFGTSYQGVEHTKTVAIENAVGFGLVLTLSVWAHARKSLSGSYSANLLLFALLSWCAFPYLGETP